jgi:putative transposase
MKRKRFTEDQIITILREHEVGAKAGDLARKHGIPRRRCWKAKYGGMDVSDAKHYGRREQKAEEVAG